MNRQPCSRRTLAEGDLALVEQCSCGSVHVTLGTVTVRIPSAALASIAATLGQAARAAVLRDAFSTRTPTSDLVS
jgi:hypothetical protein